ncbi:ABC transporter substrate-binding protein [Jiangella mangrovi]|uniref:Peptide/nickel transport system substrate-binding protein n=1 Tax=Jiangella mangrovi TaxID=1524084 RepID=A0A7W9GRC0_9ACTN|nr:ABC transporter substrate-binding protein [Jiangella mangrovi]MBB5788612.1 peptide/nickel transport system substrate-binding protein [Jiangella mangrovi]
MRVHRKAGRLVALTAAAGLLVAACGGDDAGESGESGTGGSEDGGGDPKTFIFGSSEDPKTLDASYVSDGESLRVIYQVYETLVALEPGTTNVVPGLAEDWEISPDGLTYTFNLRQGVTFHDGEPFNAEAVCFNFDRWYNFTGPQQSGDVSYYWQTVFGGFATADLESSPATSRYGSCEATDEFTATLNLTEPSSALLAGLVLPPFSIASPKAIEEGGTDIEQAGDSLSYTGGFGSEVVAGTGPFKFVSWERGESLTLERNDDYWGDAPALDEIIFRPIPDATARLQALQAGEIDAYEGVNAADIGAIEGNGDQVVERPAFNVGYVGFNNKLPIFQNEKIRQAISHALNRQGLLDAAYPEGAQVANQFLPPEQWGYNDSIEGYEYDPELAKQLIADSGETDLTLEFWYPADVSRPYMPDPQAVYESFAADLQAVGFTIVPKTVPWTPDYLQNIQGDGLGQLFLLGWTGDYADPDNFVGTFFRQDRPEFGFTDPTIQGLLNEALAETDQAAREALYQEANQAIYDYIPGVPFVHNQPLLAVAGRVTGYTPSPVSLEDFDLIDIEG